MEFVILAGVIGLIPAFIARSRGLANGVSEFAGWWVFSALLFIVALPVAIFQRSERQSPDVDIAVTTVAAQGGGFIERRGERGIGGKICLTLFWIWQVFMAIWLLSFYSDVGTDMSAHSDAAYQAGASIGLALGTGFVLFVWAAGTVITGALAFFTRGARQWVAIGPVHTPSS